MTGEATTPVIVVGIDGSPSSADAVRWALEYADVVGGAVRAVYAWSPPAVASAGLPMLTFDWTELRDEAKSFPAQFVAPLAQEHPGVRVTPVMKTGAPAQALVDESGHADLLVVGSRGLGGLKGMVLGSVGHHCAAHSRCPVVIVHPIRREQKRLVRRERLHSHVPVNARIHG